MRASMHVLLGGLLVAAMTGSAWAEIVVANSAGTVWVLNDNLTTKVQSVESDFPGAVDVSGMANGDILITSNYGTGSLWMRKPDLGYRAENLYMGTSFATTAAVGLGSGDAFVGTMTGDSLVKYPNLTTHASKGGGGDVITSVAGLTNGKLVAASEIGNGYLVLSNNDATLSWVASDGGYGTGIRLAGLSTGNILASNAAGELRIKSGSDLSGVNYEDGFGAINAIGEFADGRIAVVNSSGSLFVRNSSLGRIFDPSAGFGSVPEIAALPNGLMAIPNAAGELRLVDSSGAGMGYRDGFGSIVSISYVVPEPSALALVGTALFGLLAYAWRRRR